MIEATSPAAGEAVQETPALPPLDVGAPDQPKSPETDSKSAAEAPQDGAENQAQETDETGKDDGKRNRVPASIRIAQLTGKYRTEKARADYYEQQFNQLQNRARAQPENLDEMSFEDRERHRMRSVLDERDAERLQQEAQQSQIEAHNARADLFEQRMEEAKDRLPPDTLDKFSRLTITPEMAEAIMDSERTPELVHHLTMNPQVAAELAELSDPRRLARMSPEAAAQAGRRLASRIAGIEARLRPAQPRKATNAPAPGTKLVGGQAPASQSLEEIDDMDAYSARRKASWEKGGK